ncbi:hypothetical protein ACI65C_009046 [Semiaphis heraclei]
MGNHRGGSRRSTNNKPDQGVTLMKLRHRNRTTPADKRPQRPEPKSPTSFDNESSIASKSLTHSSTTIGSNNKNTSIQIQIGDKELRLSAVYKKPDTPLLTSDLDSLLNTSHYVVIAGDLNAKHESWNSRRQNTAGNTLAKFLDKRRDLTIAAPTSPTHYPDNPNHNADIMDVAILKTGKQGN